MPSYNIPYAKYNTLKAIGKGGGSGSKVHAEANAKEQFKSINLFIVVVMKHFNAEKRILSFMLFC